MSEGISEDEVRIPSTQLYQWRGAHGGIAFKRTHRTCRFINYHEIIPRRALHQHSGEICTYLEVFFNSYKNIDRELIAYLKYCQQTPWHGSCHASPCKQKIISSWRHRKSDRNSGLPHSQTEANKDFIKQWPRVLLLVSAIQWMRGVIARKHGAISRKTLSVLLQLSTMTVQKLLISWKCHVVSPLYTFISLEFWWRKSFPTSKNEKIFSLCLPINAWLS